MPLARRRGRRGPGRAVGGRPRRVALRSDRLRRPRRRRVGPRDGRRPRRVVPLRPGRDSPPAPRRRRPHRAVLGLGRGQRPAALPRLPAVLRRQARPSPRSARRSASSWRRDGIRVHVIAPGPIVPAAGQHPEGAKPPCSRRRRSGTGAARTKWRAGSSRSSGRRSSPARRSGSMAGVTWAEAASTVLATSTGHPVGCVDPCSVGLQLGSLRLTVGIGLPTPIYRSSLHAAN